MTKRTTRMKECASIDAVEVNLVPSGGDKDWVFVKLVSDRGVVGWGECYTTPGREGTVTNLAESLGSHLIGRDVFSIKHFTSVAYADFATKRGSLEFYSALSGLEQAMWDVVGKTLEQPVYNLLGGRCRDRIRVYANGWSHGSNSSAAADGEQMAETAAELVKRGFTALKFDPLPGPWRTQVSGAEERSAIETVAAVREAVGPDVDLLIELHRRLAPAAGARLAAKLEQYDPFWIEEPVSSTHLSGLRRVREASETPIVTGEALYGHAAFREVFAQEAADIINPDVAACGGILELTQIAATADTFHVAVSPHNYNSPSIALAATLQASAVMPNFLITEYFVNFEDSAFDLVKSRFEVEDGHVALPTSPGLGIEVDEDAVAKRLGSARAARRVLTPSSEER